jgi:glycosyltransferase involved in cell wall biosynthesis
MRRPISALLPIRDGEKWVLTAIDNLNRTLLPIDEVIIVDDGSTDRTLEILNRTDFKCSAKVLSNRSPGLVNALNLGIAEARNLWIARYDVDDEYIDERIDLQIGALEEDDVAIFSDFQIFSEEREYLGYITSPLTHLAIYLSLLKSERNAHPSVIFRRDAVLKVGGYLESDFPCEDLSLWLRLAEVGNLKGIPHPTLKYVLRRASVSGVRYREAKSKTQVVVDKYFNFGINLKLSDLHDSFCIYKKTTLSLERKLFLLRDLFEFNSRSKFKPELRAYLLLQTLFSFFNPKLLFVCIRELRDRKRRQKYRVS